MKKRSNRSKKKDRPNIFDKAITTRVVDQTTRHFSNEVKDNPEDFVDAILAESGLDTKVDRSKTKKVRNSKVM